MLEERNNSKNYIGISCFFLVNLLLGPLKRNTTSYFYIKYIKIFCRINVFSVCVSKHLVFIQFIARTSFQSFSQLFSLWGIPSALSPSHTHHSQNKNSTNFSPKILLKTNIISRRALTFVRRNVINFHQTIFLTISYYYETLSILVN